MLELLVGTGLAAAAGLNAWMPLFVLGLIDRFVPGIELPASWAWLSSDIALWITGILLVVEIIADKIPAVDSVNDILQTVVRPASGGIAFGAGSAAESFRVEDPAAFFTDSSWMPVLIGVVIALLVHVAKAAVRPIANLASAGVAAPLLSTAEDVSALALTVAAIFAPLIAGILLIAFAVGLIVFLRRRRRQRAESAAAAASG